MDSSMGSGVGEYPAPYHSGNKRGKLKDPAMTKTESQHLKIVIGGVQALLGFYF